MKQTTLKADVLLLLAAAIWGGAFVGQRAAMDHVGPLWFNALRFAIGAIVLLPAVAARRMNRGRNLAATKPWIVGGWVLAGILLFFGATLQQSGLVTTTAGKAGFITTLYVVLVPIFGLAAGQRTASTTWLGAGLAIIGLYFLSVTATFEIGDGDLRVFGCAIVWAAHVLVIAWLAPRSDPIDLATFQYAVVAVVSLGAALLRESVTLDGLRASTWSLLYCGVASVGIAYTLQVVGQRDAPPAHAAILLGFEAVFAAASGYLLLDERFGPREFLGSALMLAGIIVSQAGLLSPPRTRGR